jgi:nucleotide-binding universal stress UspA family protein
MMELPLVVGVDGGKPCFRAVDWAADEAQRFALPLKLVYASLWERYEDTAFEHSGNQPGWRVLAENAVGTAAERVAARTPDVKTETEVLAKDTVTALLREGVVASALVTGNRGRGEFSKMLLGSVGQSLAAHATCPVIVVRGDAAGVKGRHRRVLLGIDDTDIDSAAVRFAFREAEVRECPLDVVRVWNAPSRPAVTPQHDEGAHSPQDQGAAFLEECTAAAARDHPGVLVRPITLEGPAHKVLPTRTGAADLLVIGVRRRRGIGMRLGRLAHRALTHSACPVAIVPQPPWAPSG